MASETWRWKMRRDEGKQKKRDEGMQMKETYTVKEKGKGNAEEMKQINQMKWEKKLWRGKARRGKAQ